MFLLLNGCSFCTALTLVSPGLSVAQTEARKSRHCRSTILPLAGMARASMPLLVPQFLLNVPEPQTIQSSLERLALGHFRQEFKAMSQMSELPPWPHSAPLSHHLSPPVTVHSLPLISRLKGVVRLEDSLSRPLPLQCPTDTTAIA